MNFMDILEIILFKIPFRFKRFLNEIALESENDEFNGEAVSMMSIHASKGLEFKNFLLLVLKKDFSQLLVMEVI